MNNKTTLVKNKIPFVYFGHCPQCGQRVTEAEETAFGICCQICGQDFWFSEALPPEYHSKNLFTMNELRQGVK